MHEHRIPSASLNSAQLAQENKRATSGTPPHPSVWEKNKDCTRTVRYMKKRTY